MNNKERKISQFHSHKSPLSGDSSKGDIGTVEVNGKIFHITELDEKTLCNEWAKQQREIKELYAVNALANKGWRGVVLRLMGVYLPDKSTTYLGGKNGNHESLYPK